MALVESKQEHSSRSSLEAHRYRSLGSILGGVAQDDILEQTVKRRWEQTLEELFARGERVQLGYERCRNDECSFKVLKS